MGVRGRGRGEWGEGWEGWYVKLKKLNKFILKRKKRNERFKHTCSHTCTQTHTDKRVKQANQM